MSVRLVELIMEERIIATNQRSYSFTYQYSFIDFVNVEDQQALFEEIFKNISLFYRQLVDDLSNTDGIDIISYSDLTIITIEIDQESDWIKDGLENEVITKIQECVDSVFGSNIEVFMEDLLFL